MAKRKSPLNLYLVVALIVLILLVTALTVAVVVLATKLSNNQPQQATSTSTAGTPPGGATTTAAGQPPNDPYNMPMTDQVYQMPMMQNVAMQNNISKQLINAFQPMNVRDNLKWLTRNVHVAGTPDNQQVMSQLATQYSSYGLQVKTYQYQVLLSYPNYSAPNTVEVMPNGQSQWQLLSNGLAQRLGPAEAMKQEADSRALNWWNGYANAGTAVGQIVYVHYGSLKDFQLLDKNGISLQGKIALARYGDIFRGSIAQMAEQRQAKGVIIYTDPQDYASNKPPNQTFPNSIYMPPSGAQRGSLMTVNGDPLTPLYPSKPYTFRSTDENTLRSQMLLPNVPVMPMGYRDAIKLFQNMDGPALPTTGDFSDWRGGMNVTYRMNSGTYNFRLNVRGYTAQRTIQNVVATLPGKDEPDRWVMFGNHVDAWTFGAIDPNSGTAVSLEMARVLMQVVNSTGWTPKRSIVFAQWDAEEYGLIGSTEYIEEFLKPLTTRAVAMINVDNIAGNMTLRVKGVPMLYRALVAAAAVVLQPNPNEVSQNRTTLLSSWKYYHPIGPIPGDRSVPRIYNPGGGSDFEKFISYAGVPSSDLKMICIPSCYTVYHSMYEIEWTVEALMDQRFLAFTALGQMWLEVGRNLADSLVIPFNVHDYGTMMRDVFVPKLDKYLRSVQINNVLSDFPTAMQNLYDASSRFEAITNTFQRMVAAANSGTQNVTFKQVQMLNSRLMQLERAFVDEFGLYDERKSERHVVFATSLHDAYAEVTFAGVLDPVFNWMTATAANNVSMANYWAKSTRLGISRVQYAIESAILLLG